MALNGQVNPEQLTTFVLYVEFVTAASLSVCDQWGPLMEAIGASERVMYYLDRPPAPQIAAGRKLPSWSGKVHPFHHLCCVSVTVDGRNPRVKRVITHLGARQCYSAAIELLSFATVWGNSSRPGWQFRRLMCFGALQRACLCCVCHDTLFSLCQGEGTESWRLCDCSPFLCCILCSLMASDMSTRVASHHCIITTYPWLEWL